MISGASKTNTGILESWMVNVKENIVFYSGQLHEFTAVFSWCIVHVQLYNWPSFFGHKVKYFCRQSSAALADGDYMSGCVSCAFHASWLLVWDAPECLSTSELWRTISTADWRHIFWYGLPKQNSSNNRGMMCGVPLKCGSAGLLGAVLAHWEQWWLIESNYGSLGSSGGSLVGAVVAHLSGAVLTHWWEVWWLIGGSSGG
jgi:hypothetical protein